MKDLKSFLSLRGNEKTTQSNLDEHNLEIIILGGEYYSDMAASKTLITNLFVF